MPRNPTSSAISDESGAVAIIFAVAIIPITMLTALVIDYGWVIQAKSKLDLAADAAALAAARTAAAGYAGGKLTPQQYTQDAIDAANQWWAAQAGSIPQAKSFSETPTIKQTGNNFVATVSYTANISEILPNLFQTGTANASGNSSNAVSTGAPPPVVATGATIANTISASITVNAYGTVDFLLDNTSSMMLPATDADLLKLQTVLQASLPNSPIYQADIWNGGSGLIGWNAATNTSWGLTGATSNMVSSGGTTVPMTSLPVSAYCAFACHWSATSTAANPSDYYGAARAAGETLRFDVVQSATITAIQQMDQAEKAVGQLSVGVYTFGGVNMTSPTYLTKVYAETPIDPLVNGTAVRHAGATAAIAALSTITPPVSGDIPNTNIGVALGDLQAGTGPSGNGSTALTPLKSVILVTDGIEDDTNPQNIPSTEGPIRPAVCSAMKSAGYTVFILYTPYNSAPQYLPNNMALQPYITGASSPSVLSALQSCASSPNDVIQATAPSDIQAGMVALINEAVGTTTQLTN